jgi:hypothetical protein
MPTYATETTGASGGSPASIDYVTTQGVVLAALAEPPTGSALGGHVAETVAPTSATAALTMTSGSLSIAAIRLVAGQTVQGCGFVTSTTAGATMTHWWTALLDSGYACRAVSADQTSGAIAASTWFTQAFAAAYTATYTGIYYLGVMVAAATIPTLCGATAPLAAMVTGTGAPAPLLGGVSSTSQTTAPVAGTTVFIAPTAAAVTPYLFAY